MGGAKQVGELGAAPVGAVMSRGETAAQALPVQNGARVWDDERKVETVEWIVQRAAGEVLLACSDVTRMVNLVDDKAMSTSVTGGLPGQVGYSARCNSIHSSGSNEHRGVSTRTTTATLLALEPSRAVIDLSQSSGSYIYRAGHWVFDVTPVYGDALLTRVVLTMSGSMTFRFIEGQVRKFRPLLVLFCCLSCLICAMQEKQLHAHIDAALGRLSTHINHYVSPAGTAPLAVAQEVGAASGVAPTEDRVAALERLAALRDQHVLTQDEFLAEKQRVLAMA
jgi:hypothetical protein